MSNCTSCKHVGICATDSLSRWSGTVGPINRNCTSGKHIAIYATDKPKQKEWDGWDD